MPRVVDHDQRRQELLEQCFALFAREGYAGLTMRRIAKDIGTSTGTLYHYFDGKADLFAQMFRWIRRRDILEIAASVPPDVPLDQRLDLLRLFLVGHADAMSQALRIALEFHREATAPDDRALLAETLADYRGAIEEQLGIADPVVSGTVLSLLLGILTQHVLDPAHVDIDAQMARVRLLVG